VRLALVVPGDGDLGVPWRVPQEVVLESLECPLGVVAGGEADADGRACPVPAVCRRHQVQENLDELPGLRVVEELHPGMLAPALDARPVGDRDRLVSLQAKAPVMAVVADDVPGPKAVDGQRRVTG
jgi:hypothetical protein